ncbi:MAG: baiB [Ilumatobacteraceae bacterium]|nr:baiB [Ilumatobacteraceae bacterium]
MVMLTYSRAIADNAARQPDRVAISCADDSITWAELEARTNRLARAYAALGVTRNSFVTIGLPNSIGFFEACIAAWKLGATPQPISYRLPDRERTAIVELADSSLVVGADPAAHPGRTVIPAGYEPDPTLDDAQLPDAFSDHWKAPTSGGSTGRPKLIVATDPSIANTEVQGLGQRRDGVVIVPGPLYHNAPFSFSNGGLMAGNHVVILPKFDAEATLAAIDRHRADWMLLVPTMMQRITRLPDEVRDRYDVSSLQTVWHMASPCPPWLKEAWIDWLGGEKIFELYAGTEAQSVTVVRGDEWMAHRGTVGRPVSGEMRIQDPETFEVLPTGEVGEVFMRTGTDRRTYEYIGAEARTSPDGWESLGDMGSMDADGYLYLADRRSDMILSGGANIYPAEIEAAIDEHPAVVSCAAIGLPDEDLGNRIHAVVQISEPIDVDELRAFLAERLVRYKIPRTFEFVTDEVRGHDGKVRRSALRDSRS